MEKSVMTMGEVAKYLSFSVKHIQRMVTSGEIPCSRVGGELRFLKSRIDEWVREQEMKPSVFCAACNRVFTEPLLPSAKGKKNSKNPMYVRTKQYLDGGEYFCAACFAKTKLCSRCGKYFLPALQSQDPESCPRCAGLEAVIKK
jgi:excisionase family DNA binding protein